jgi:hypothetical protein
MSLHPLTYWSVDALRRSCEHDPKVLVDHLRAHIHRLDNLVRGSRCTEDYRMTNRRSRKSTLDKCVHLQERHLLRNKRKLRRYDKNLLCWGLERAMSLWRNGYRDESIEHLAECVPRYRWAGKEFLQAVCTIADASGIFEETEEALNRIIKKTLPLKFDRLDNVSPHLHCSERPDGSGASVSHFYYHFESVHHWLYDGLCFGSVRCSPTSWFDEITPGSLVNSALKGYILGSILPDEIEEMLHRFHAWRKHTCLLALHPRAGAASALHALGPDLLKMILDMI